MTDSKDAERLAQVVSTFKDCVQWNVGPSAGTLELALAQIARLDQERDEARRSAEMLKARYGYTEPAIEAAERRGRQQATQPSADDVGRNAGDAANREAADVVELVADDTPPSPAPGDVERARDSWPDPTPEMLNDPLFNAIWETIKTWDINVPGVYSGYCSATGNHARKILDNIAVRREERDEARRSAEALQERVAVVDAERKRQREMLGDPRKGVHLPPADWGPPQNDRPA